MVNWKRGAIMLSRARSVFARGRINVDSFGIKNAAHDVAIPEP
jgi:hypothetical protein